jgi:adenylate cyclase
MGEATSALQRGRIRLFLRVLAFAAAVGAVYGALMRLDGLSTGISMAVGVANSLLISGCIASIEIFIIRGGAPLRLLNRLPFIAVLAMKTLVYGTIVSFVVLGVPRVGALFPTVFPTLALDRATANFTIGFSLVVTALFVVILQAASLVGRRTFRDLVLGRYRRPRAERRFFLFVDVVGSTAIAERLGALQAHEFLAAVFSATAEPIAAAQGEIYQYVGDEIVVTWTEAEGRQGEENEARPLRCFFDMEAALAARAAEFKRRFGAIPGLRAALHLGEVIAGEVGEQRRAIVFHGDVMNTASRLEQATREVGARFIASDEAVTALEKSGDFPLKDLGELQLRGRKNAIRAWSVERN